MVEVHNQHEDDYEPEETYIIPNCPPVSGEISKQSTTATRSNQQGNQTSNQYRGTGENANKFKWYIYVVLCIEFQTHSYSDFLQTLTLRKGYVCVSRMGYSED